MASGPETEATRFGVWRILGFMLLGLGLKFKAGHVVMKRDFALVADALAKTCSNVDVWQGWV